MARRDVFLHLGPSRLGTDLFEDVLTEHADTLAVRGVRRAGTPEGVFRAAVELAWDHRAWGFRRRDVEGAWAEVCREARRQRRSTRAVVVSERMLAALDRPAVDLLLDQLAGMRPRLVLTVTAPDGQCRAGDPATDLVDVLDRWVPALRDPGRVHVVVLPGCRCAGETVRRALADLVGVALPPTAPRAMGRPPASVDPTVDDGERARRTALALSWVRALAASGVRVHGDPADLLPGTPPEAPGDEGQCGCQASSSAVREVTALGSLPSASAWMEVCSKTSRRDRRAAIHTCWSTSAESL